MYDPNKGISISLHSRTKTVTENLRICKIPVKVQCFITF